MSSKIAKTIARQKEKIAEGQFYEAHQQLRVITSRYLKANDYTSAADILSNGSLLLLRAGQGGSGGDLASMLVNDVYIKGEYDVTAENKQRLLDILRAYPSGDPTRKRFVGEVIGWSGRFGEAEKGDAELHHAVGEIYAGEGEAYEAEKHLLLGTAASPPILSSLVFNWYRTDSPHTAALYASRPTLSYLVLGNLKSATLALSTFTGLLIQSQPSLPTQQIDSSRSSVRIFPSLPLLNFLSLLVLACQKADASSFRQLTKHFAPHLKDVEEYWDNALTQIGEIWFGIKIPKQGGNPLFDMMGSMLFGGNQGGGSGGGGAKGPPKPKAVGPPVAMDLD